MALIPPAHKQHSGKRIFKRELKSGENVKRSHFILDCSVSSFLKLFSKKCLFLLLDGKLLVLLCFKLCNI